MKKKLVIGIILLIVFVLLFILLFDKKEVTPIEEEEVGQVLSYVTLDINPSIELALDENEIVVDAVTLNEDADIAFSDINLIGLSIEDATEKIIDESIELGYITEVSETNLVNVTSYIEDEIKREELNRKIVANINAHFEAKKVYALVVQNGLDEELKTKAETYDIAYGKMLLVARAISLDDSLVESDLVKLSVKSIQAEIKEKAIIRREEVINAFREEQKEFIDIKSQRIAEAKVKLQQAKDEILRGVQNSSGLTNDQKQNIIEEKKGQIKEEIDDLNANLNKNGTIIKENTVENIREKYLKKGQ